MPAPGTYFLLIAADNSEVGKIIREGDVQGYTSYTSGYSTPGYSWKTMVGPQGKLRLKVKLKS